MDAPALGGRVVGAQVVATSIPLRRLLRRSSGSAPAPLLTREVSWLRLRGDDGSAGIGEASAVDWLSERSAAATRRELGSLATWIVATKPAASLLLERSLDVSLSSTARAGLQCALLDLEARRRGVSLAELLGAAPGGTLGVSALLSGDAAAATEEAARYRTAGFGTIKLKVADAEADVARVFDVRAAAGPQMRLRLDANGAWDAAQAGAALRALRAADVDFIEEPLGDRSPSRFASLRLLRGLMPVAVDESIVERRDLDAVIAEDAADVLVLKLERVGGPLPALALAKTAFDAGVRVVFTDSIESAVGRAATAHVARAAGSSEDLGLGGAFFLARAAAPQTATNDAADAAKQPTRSADADTDTDVPPTSLVIRGPGLGVEFSEHDC